jgi:microcystin-dependent protein
MDFPSSPINGQTTTDGRYYFDSSVGTSGAWRSAPLPVGGLPAGSIMAWGTNTPPANWLIADGSAVSRSTFSSLFAVIGTQYGAGNGTTTFNLPDLRGRVPVGRNGGTFGTLAGTGGAETHSLTASQQADMFVWQGSQDFANSSTTGTLGGYVFNPAGANNGAQRLVARGGGTTGQAHNILQPYLVVNYIIKATAGWTAGDSELATRLGAVETAQATTNRSGLVPVAPLSIAVSSGSGSANAAGLVSFSGAGTVTLNNIFTGAYRNYRIVVNVGSLTAASSGINFRYRSAGVDENTNFYFQGALLHRAAGTTANYTTQNDSLNYLVGVNVTGNPASIILDVQNPQLSIKTTGLFNASGWDAGSPTAFIGTTLNNQNKSFDGFTLICPTGTMTDGSVQVYGYR